MVLKICEANQQTPKQGCNKIISKLRKYAKENGHFITVEKWHMADNSGEVYIYFTTNRFIGNSVRFTFDVTYRNNVYTVFCLEESDAPSFSDRKFDSYEEEYNCIFNHIIEYGKV